MPADDEEWHLHSYRQLYHPTLRATGKLASTLDLLSKMSIVTFDISHFINDSTNATDVVR